MVVRAGLAADHRDIHLDSGLRLLVVADRPGETGVTFNAEQIMYANPDSLTTNQIQFDYRSGAFTFLPGNAAGNAELGSLYI